MDTAVQLDLFKPYHPNVHVYFQPADQPVVAGVEQKNIWSVIEVSDVESVDEAMREVHQMLKAEGTRIKSPLLGFIKGGKYGSV